MILSYNNFDRKAHSDLYGLECKDPSMAVQSQKAEADINNIVRDFGVTGILPQGVKIPTYGDFTGVNDYRSALEAIESAKNSFMAMSAETRKRFDNDPQQFVEFCSDSRNLEEMRKLGLAVPVAEDKSSPAPSGA